jgi:hypothetical protein
MICAAVPFTCSLSFSFMYHSDSWKLPQQDNQTRTNFEIESATSPWKIGLWSWMMYHWKAQVFCFYAVRAHYQFNALWILSRSRQLCHDFTTKQNKFWTWKSHISMKNRTPKSNKVSLESSSILLLCFEGVLPIKCALDTLKVKTIVPWLHNQTKWRILNLKVAHLHEQ